MAESLDRSMGSDVASNGSSDALPCSHHSHTSVASPQQLLAPLPTKYFQELLHSVTPPADECTAWHVNKKINEIFVKRLEDIDQCPGDNTEMKLQTCQEWVASLVERNEKLLRNALELEHDVYKRLESVQPSAQQDVTIASYKRDIAGLLELIKTAYYEKKWNIAESKFETFDLQKFLKQNGNMKAKASEKTDKQKTDVEALVKEVAVKHDVVQEMRTQVSRLELDNQNAQKRIQFLESVIKDLRDSIHGKSKAAQ